MRSIFRILGLTLAVAGLSACGSSSSPVTEGDGGHGGDSGHTGDGGHGGDAGDGGGTWSCMDSVSNTLTAEAGSKTTMTSEASQVVITSDGAGMITLTATGDGGGDCVLHATVSGSTFMVESGQSCVTTNGLTRTFTSGSASLSGDSFMSTHAFTISGTITLTLDGGATRMVTVTGTGTSTGTCTKG